MQAKRDLWVCITCDRPNRTNFCGHCGTKAPSNADVREVSLSDLKKLREHCVKVAQGRYSAHQTALSIGGSGRAELKSYVKHKRFAEAVEWAINELSRCTTA